MIILVLWVSVARSVIGNRFNNNLFYYYGYGLVQFKAVDGYKYPAVKCIIVKK